MAKFITGDELNSEIGKIITSANEKLILISPFIKLHERLKSTLLYFTRDKLVDCFYQRIGTSS